MYILTFIQKSNFLKLDCIIFFFFVKIFEKNIVMYNGVMHFEILSFVSWDIRGIHVLYVYKTNISDLVIKCYITII